MTPLEKVFSEDEAFLFLYTVPVRRPVKNIFTCCILGQLPHKTLLIASEIYGDLHVFVRYS